MGSGMSRVLIVDDDRMMSNMLADIVSRMGLTATTAFTVEEALRKTATERFDVVMLDVRLPDGNGLEIIPRIRQAPAEPEVIIITGEGDPDGAELAIKNGAWDYIEKPASVKGMTLPLVRALQFREEKRSQQKRIALKRDNIIGNSLLLKTCLDLVAQAAGTDAHVLITGETGTGKELFAAAIHENSARARRPFVVVDCAALPETLVESTLFGHERGAFTGADRSREGLIRQADGGTLFLDEVGELPLGLQKTFLRVLQEKRFRPVGSGREITSDFRLVAATNRNLQDMAGRGEFRQDLLYRLQSIVVHLPSLRKRPGDIKALVSHFLSLLGEREDNRTKGVSPDFMDALQNYAWPGNVRELIGALESAVTAAGDSPTLFPYHLPTAIRIHHARTTVMISPDEPEDDECPPTSRQTLPPLADYRQQVIQRIEREYLQDLMLVTDGDIREACRMSGLSRPRLYALLKNYDITRKH